MKPKIGKMGRGAGFHYSKQAKERLDNDFRAGISIRQQIRDDSWDKRVKEFNDTEDN